MFVYRVYCLLLICLPGWLGAQALTTIDLRSGFDVRGIQRFHKGTPSEAGISPKVYNPLTLAIRSEISPSWTLETSVGYYMHRNFFSFTLLREGDGYIRGQRLFGGVSRNQIALMISPSFVPFGNRYVSAFAGLGVGCFISELYDDLRIESRFADGSTYETTLQGHGAEPLYTLLAGFGARFHMPLTSYLGIHLEGRAVLNWTLSGSKDDPPFVVDIFPRYDNHVLAVSLGLSYHLSAVSKVPAPVAQ